MPSFHADPSLVRQTMVLQLLLRAFSTPLHALSNLMSLGWTVYERTKSESRSPDHLTINFPELVASNHNDLHKLPPIESQSPCSLRDTGPAPKTTLGTDASPICPTRLSVASESHSHWNPS